MRGLSLVAASGGHSSSQCAGLSLLWPLLLRSTGSRRAGSVIVAHGPSCSAACGIFPDQGSNPCPLHWQADSQPLRHQGSPRIGFSICKDECREREGTSKIYNIKKVMDLSPKPRTTVSPEQGKPGQKGSSIEYGVSVWDEEKVLEIALMDTTTF